MLVLLTVKEYCKKYAITDAAVRKSNTISTVTFKDLTYVVIENNFIETLKNKIKLQIANTKSLRNELMIYTKQDEIINEQKERIKKLSERIESLEEKLDKQTDTKEMLYEKVIGHMLKLENKE